MFFGAHESGIARLVWAIQEVRFVTPTPMRMRVSSRRNGHPRTNLSNTHCKINDYGPLWPPTAPGKASTPPPAEGDFACNRKTERQGDATERNTRSNRTPNKPKREQPWGSVFGCLGRVAKAGWCRWAERATGGKRKPGQVVLQLSDFRYVRCMRGCVSVIFLTLRFFGFRSRPPSPTCREPRARPIGGLQARRGASSSSRSSSRSRSSSSLLL